MSGYCSVVVVGNLGKDPEIRSTGSGKKVASFSLAVDQGYGDNKKTEWVNIIAWEKLAELAEKFLKRGKTVALSGYLQTSSREDKQSGQKRYKTEVVARDITFMDSGSRSDGGTRQAPAPRQQAAPQARATTTTEDPFATEISDDDIPF